MLFLVVIAAYVVVMALIGGAVLARYLLPAVPLVILEAVATLRRRLRYWTAAVAVIGVAFVAAWFWNPPYGFSPEDNLAYRDYVILHQDAERFLEARYPMAHVLTAWPASDELTRPWLGYTTRPMQVVRIEDFALEQVISAADFRQNFDVALIFSTKYEPARPLLNRWPAWTELKHRFFGYERDLPAAAAAQILGGHVVFSETRKGERIAVIEMEKAEILNARELSIAPHQMAGVSLDHQPHFLARREFQRIARREGQVDFHFNSALHACGHDDIALLERLNSPGNDVARAQSNRRSSRE
jgi:hypothetical protein